MKRRLLSAVLAMCLIGAAGCGGQETVETESETQAVTESVVVETESEARTEVAETETETESEELELQNHYGPVKENMNISEIQLNGIKFSELTLKDNTTDNNVQIILSGILQNNSDGVKEFGFSYTLYYEDGEIFLEEKLSNANYRLSPGEIINFNETMESPAGEAKPVTGYSINGLVPFEKSIKTITADNQSEAMEETDPVDITENKTANINNPLVEADITVSDVMNGFATEKIGEWAEIRVSKDVLKQITQDQYKEFCNNVVEDSGYNWFTVNCEDGTGIQFTGSMTQIGTYGNIDTDGRVEEVKGYITVTENGYEYSEAE